MWSCCVGPNSLDVASYKLLMVLHQSWQVDSASIIIFNTYMHSLQYGFQIQTNSTSLLFFFQPLQELNAIKTARQSTKHKSAWRASLLMWNMPENMSNANKCDRKRKGFHSRSKIFFLRPTGFRFTLCLEGRTIGWEHMWHQPQL